MLTKVTLSPEDKQKIRDLRTQKHPLSYMDIESELIIPYEQILLFCKQEGLNKRRQTKKEFFHGVHNRK